MIVVSGGDVDLRAAGLAKIAQRVERVPIDACAVEQVACQQNRIALLLAAERGKRLQRKALFLPPAACERGGKCGKCGIQMEIRCVQQSNHAASPFLRPYSGRSLRQW